MYGSVTMDIKPPWDPFKSYEDFSFTEWVASAHLSSKHIDKLLYLMKNVWGSNCRVSFNSHYDLEKVFEPSNPISVPVSV
jgi:hypothetical protein